MLLAVYLRKELRPVIVRGRSGNRRPSYVVRGGKRIAAFVEIALETGAMPGLEFSAEKG